MSTESVFEALDEAAVKLLARADDFENVEGGSDGAETSVSIGDHVKAFEAVVAYAALRAKLEPPRKLQESKFDELRTRFHGSTSGGGAGRKNGSSHQAGKA